MAPLHVQLRLIMQRFPDQVEHIEELYEHNADFRTLCGDYFLCCEYLKESKTTFTKKHEAIEEYENLQSELEKELNNFLSEE